MDVDDPDEKRRVDAEHAKHEERHMNKSRLKIEDFDRSAFQEIRQLRQPPLLVLTVCTSVCRILGHTKKECDEWTEVQSIMHDEGFRKRLLEFQPLREKTLSLKKVKQIQIELQKLTHNQVDHADHVVAALYDWAVSAIGCVLEKEEKK